MAFSGVTNTVDYLVIKHGSRRRLLAKPPTFELLMKRSCEIFGFAANTELCAYFMYRNHNGTFEDTELDPSAYFILKSGDELEWRTLSQPAAQVVSNGNHPGPRYLGGGYEPASPRRGSFVFKTASDYTCACCDYGWAHADDEARPNEGQEAGWAKGGDQTATPSLEWASKKDVNLAWRPKDDKTAFPFGDMHSLAGTIISPAPTAPVSGRGLFSPRPGGKPLNGDDWLRPLPSGYQRPKPVKGRWGGWDEETPTRRWRRDSPR